MDAKKRKRENVDGRASKQKKQNKKNEQDGESQKDMERVQNLMTSVSTLDVITPLFSTPSF